MDLKEDSFYLLLMEGLKEMIEQGLSELREGKAREILERHNDKYISGKGDLVCWRSVGSAFEAGSRGGC